MIIRLWRHIFISVQGRYEKSFNILHWSHHSLIQQLHLRLISLWWTLYMVPWWLDLWTGLGVLPLPPSHNWSLTRIQPSLSFPLCKNNATKIKCVCIIQGQGPEPIRVRVPSFWETWSPEKPATRFLPVFFKEIRLFCTNISAISVACYMSEC